ncbi:MAG: Crp/Fnr family transcriptional regulator [Sphingomonas sp.]
MYMETIGATEGAAAGAALPSRCDGCPVHDRAVCGALNRDAQRELARRSRRVVLRRGETLIWEGDDALVVGTVHTGLLKLTATMDDGREQILGLACPGEFVGRPFGGRSTHSVTALAETSLCILGRSAFDAFAADHSELQHALLLRALDELDRARSWMMLLARKSAGERVASFLLEMADRAGGADGEPVEIMLSRQQIADFLGLTIETVSRKLTALRQSRLVRLPDLKSFVILNRAGLSHAAGSSDRLAA